MTFLDAGVPVAVQAGDGLVLGAQHEEQRCDAHDDPDDEPGDGQASARVSQRCGMHRVEGHDQSDEPAEESNGGQHGHGGHE